MLPLEKKRDFIAHRSEGLSLRNIEKLIGISHTTAMLWDKELEGEISTLKQEKLAELYDTYTMTREARIKTLGEQLIRIDEALTTADLSTVAPEKLLDMKLKYIEALQGEYIPYRKPLNDDGEGPTPKKLIIALAEIVDRIRTGEISDKQAERETKAIDNLLKGFETVELQKKIDMLEAVLNNR